MTDKQINQLKELKALLDSGVLTSAEYELQKSKLLEGAKAIAPENKEPTESRNTEKRRSLLSQYKYYIIAGALIIVIFYIVSAYFTIKLTQDSNYSVWGHEDPIVSATTEVSGLDLTNPIENNVKLTLDDVFCDYNVGKTLNMDYNELTDCGDHDGGEFASSMMSAEVQGGEIAGPRTSMFGEIYKENNNSDIFYCHGSTCAGASCWGLEWKYDRKKKILSAKVTSEPTY